MKKRSKRYLKLQAKLEEDKAYSLDEAIELLKESEEENTKFDQAVEVHMRLGIDAKKSDQIVRGVVQLPHGTGKTKKVIAFVTPEQEADAKKAGADLIGDENAIQEIKKTGKVNFEVAIATPQMMKKVGPVAKILGQKGLMPNPKNETVGPDVVKMIEGVKAGKLSFKNDDSANMHAMVGRASFDAKKLKENINAFVQAVKVAKPTGTKGVYIKRATICSSMGPAIKVKIN